MSARAKAAAAAAGSAITAAYVALDRIRGAAWLLAQLQLGHLADVGTITEREQAHWVCIEAITGEATKAQGQLARAEQALAPLA